MNIQNRLKKLENEVAKEDTNPRIVWDFGNTTTEQLLKLKSLIKSNDPLKAGSYTAELLNKGFLSRRSRLEMK